MTLTASEFGYFAVAYTIMGVSLVIWRSGSLINLYAAPDPAIRRAAFRTLGHILLFVSPVIIAGGVLILVLARAVITWQLVLLLATIPVILRQDLQRHRCFLTGRAQTAVYADGVWLVFAGISYALALLRLVDFTIVIMLWVAGLVLSLVVVSLRTSPLDSAPAAAVLTRSQYLRVERTHLTRNFLAGAVGPAAGLISITLVSRIAGADTVAPLVVLPQVLFPCTILISSLPMLLRPHGTVAPPKRGVHLAVIGAVVAVLWALVISSLPEAWGEYLVGDTWALVSPLLVFGGISFAVLTLQQTLLVSLQIRRRSGIAMTTTVAQGLARICYNVAIARFLGTPGPIVVADATMYAATSALLVRPYARAVNENAGMP